MNNVKVMNVISIAPLKGSANFIVVNQILQLTTFTLETHVLLMKTVFMETVWIINVLVNPKAEYVTRSWNVMLVYFASIMKRKALVLHYLLLVRLVPMESVLDFFSLCAEAPGDIEYYCYPVFSLPDNAPCFLESQCEPGLVCNGTCQPPITNHVFCASDFDCTLFGLEGYCSCSYATGIATCQYFNLMPFQCGSVLGHLSDCVNEYNCQDTAYFDGSCIETNCLEEYACFLQCALLTPYYASFGNCEQYLFGDLPTYCPSLTTGTIGNTQTGTGATGTTKPGTTKAGTGTSGTTASTGTTETEETGTGTESSTRSSNAIQIGVMYLFHLFLVVWFSF